MFPIMLSIWVKGHEAAYSADSTIGAGRSSTLCGEMEEEYHLHTLRTCMYISQHKVCLLQPELVI